MNTVKAGMHIQNQKMELTVLCFAESNQTNAALLIRTSDGMFITVKNLNHDNGNYTWDWGHYFTDLHDALENYKARRNSINNC